MALGLTACGKSTEDQAVVTVGKQSITRATLAHWMSAMAGEDYAQIVRGQVPVGLVSEPADYGTCVSAAAKIPLDPKATGRLSSAQVRLKCEQLHTAIKEQALTYLIPGLWRTIEGEELGTGVSDREVSKRLQQVRYSEYPSPAAFSRYLADRRWSISDERYALKRTMLIGNYGAKIRRQARELGGGVPTIALLLQQSLTKWSAKTDCAPGYTAIQCRERKGGGTSASPSPAQLLEQLSGKPG